MNTTEIFSENSLRVYLDLTLYVILITKILCLKYIYGDR